MEAVDQIVSDILQVCAPRRVILFAEKRTMATNKLKALSLCVIVDEGDCRALRPRLHLAASADVPINFSVYTDAEWQTLLEDDTSYAAWISRKGQVVYEQKA